MSPTGYEQLTPAALRHALVAERARRAAAQRQVALIEREMKRRRRASPTGK